MRAPIAASLLLVLAVSPIAGQPADTTKISTEPLFTSRDAIVAGAFVLGTVALFPADKHFAREIQNPRTQTNQFLSETAKAFRITGYPGSLYIGGSMYAVGKLVRNKEMADLGLHGTEAILVASLTTGVLKQVFGRARPLVDVDDPTSWQFMRGDDGDQFRSFPSGHTVASFAAAAAVVSETHRWWPKTTWLIAPAMYGGAAMVGVSRMYNNKHWASDVLMGAAIGTFAGQKVVRYHHSHPGNLIDRILLGATFVPMPDGMALAWSGTIR